MTEWDRVYAQARFAIDTGELTPRQADPMVLPLLVYVRDNANTLSEAQRAAFSRFAGENYMILGTLRQCCAVARQIASERCV